MKKYITVIVDGKDDKDKMTKELLEKLADGYIRVVTSCAGATGGVIMTETEFAEWLRDINLPFMLKEGYSFSISPVKKSPLLTNKKKS